MWTEELVSAKGTLIERDPRFGRIDRFRAHQPGNRRSGVSRRLAETRFRAEHGVTGVSGAGGSCSPCHRAHEFLRISSDELLRALDCGCLLYTSDAADDL